MPPESGKTPKDRLMAGCGGFLLGGILGGAAACGALWAYYAGHPHQDSGSIGEAAGAAFVVLAVAFGGFAAGGIAGAAGLVWLSGRARSRPAAGVLSWIGILGAAASVATAGLWWVDMQATARRDVVKVRERYAREQANLDAQEAARQTASHVNRSPDPPRPPAYPEQTVTQPALSPEPPATPQPPVSPQVSTPPQSPAASGDRSDATVTVARAYGALAYPNVSKTRIASPSPRPEVPAAAAIQFTNATLESVIAYYEPKLRTIRKSETEYLGVGTRASDGLQTFVHVRNGYNDFVYVELSAG